MSDCNTIAELKKGSEQAFKKLVDEYQSMVVRICFGLLHNREDAEDVAQEVFVEIFRSSQRFRGESKLSTWIYRIAVTRSLNHIRNNRKHRWLSIFWADENAESIQRQPFEPESTSHPEYDLQNKQRAAILHQAIDSLPPRQKTVFVLRQYEDLSYHEIAEVLSLSVSSVESLLFRAKKKLQKKLYVYYRNKCI